MADKDYEDRDVAVGKIWVFAASVGVGLVATFVLMGALMIWWANHPFSPVPASPTALPTMVPSAPDLQVQPAVELHHYLVRQDKMLGSYGWKNRGERTVRIPIDRAMDLLIERGLPVLSESVTPLEMQRRKALEKVP